MLETLSGVETTIARGGLPPGITFMIGELTKNKPITEVHPVAEKELRYVLALVDGPGLLAAIVGRLIESLPKDIFEKAEAEAFDAPIVTEREQWDEAKATEADKLVMLLIGDHYIAYDQDAQMIGTAVEAHPFVEGREEKIGLPLAQQSDWQDKLEEVGLDVVLLEQDADAEGGYQRIEVLQATAAE